MAVEKTATFAVNLESNAGKVSSDATAELEKFRAQIAQSQAELKGMQGALRSLKGSSDDVAKAKEQLKAKIDAEKGTISAANLALLKHGTNYTKLTSEVVKQKTAQDKLREGVKAAGGPIADLSSKFENLKGVLSGVNGSAAAMGIGVGLLVVGVVALSTAVIDAGIKLGKFIIEGANTLRSMNLMREAAAGSAENAHNLGTQVDRLARMVPTAKEQINQLAVAMTRDMSGGLSRATGPAIVAGLEAVTVASAAAGDSVGRTFQEIIERGKNFNRFWLNPTDVDKTGLHFADVAASLAKNLHVSLDKAKQALFTGQVSLTAGAEAMRDAVNKRFGGVNAEKLLDIDTQIAKLKENLVGLTRGVVLEPLLKGLAILASEFDVTTVKGQRIQAAFAKIGTAITSFAVDHIVEAVSGVEKLIQVGVDVVNVFAKWAPRIRGVVTAFTDSSVAMTTLKVVGVGIVAVVGTLAFAFGSLATALAVGAGMIGAPIYALYEGYVLLRDLNWGKIGDAITKPFREAWKWLKGLDLADVGRSIIDGIVGGITGAAGRAVDAIKGLAGRIKDAFTGTDGIDSHSPSKFFEKGGRDSVKGYVQGTEKEAPRAQAAAQAMIPAAPRGGGGRGLAAALSGGIGGGDINVVLNIHVQGGEGSGRGHADAIAAKVSSSSVLIALTRAIRDAARSQAIPTQTAPVTP